MTTFASVQSDLCEDRPRSPSWDEYSTWLVPEWQRFLESCSSEREMQLFLERHPCLLPGATDSVGPGGHHGPSFEAVIRQPPLQGLGPKRVPDFMWVRRDTAAIRPICIEIESPLKPWFNPGSRTPTAPLTQAIDQLTEWKVWFSSPENQLIFAKTYAPRYSHRPIEPQFVLVYGRDAEFRAATSKHDDADYIRRKRDHMARDREHFFTYDQLMPESEARDYATITRHVDGWTLSAVPPTFCTGAYMMEMAESISNPSEALAKIDLVGPERKSYLLERWKFWRNVALSGHFSGELGVRE
ncbi:MAG TPA: Shedu anti-phage system protein SduA domain-containing protein [Actinocrinis sp.]|uniref:Shedu anti-phage system protein SduA domain-containing protein n=1 Tax=Actinocrinis sp. TaxID=1920516 RepID=UPI002DDCDC1B|nr:Shedu anti-phage system protein SduA domain-containing protein [Actinocrinis sp.]HEV3170376.1 Shedu anti-phage system protein SduA domain-containing protein [Actinocrinis sp.]